VGGRAEEIIAIQDVLGNQYRDLINQCPTILGQGKAEEIKSIKEIVGEDLIKQCPYILAQGNVERIRQLKEELKDDFYSVVSKDYSLLYRSDEYIKQKEEKKNRKIK
jgi:hypothetical protein